MDILQPGPGVGGHCIAVDPWFIAGAAPNQSRLIPTARTVNDLKPKFVLNQIDKYLAGQERSHCKTIGILGITFKADIDDLRESPALKIAQQLAESYPSHRLLVVEPNLEFLPSTLSCYENIKMANLDSVLDTADVLVLLVDHAVFRERAETIAAHPHFVDTRGIGRF